MADQDTFNMSMRKYLKQVGVTSQRAIEEAASGKSGKMKVRTVLTSHDGALEHVVEGEIDLG